MSTTDNNFVNACDTNDGSGSERSANNPDAVAIGVVDELDDVVGRAERGIAIVVIFLKFVFFL